MFTSALWNSISKRTETLFGRSLSQILHKRPLFICT